MIFLLVEGNTELYEIDYLLNNNLLIFTSGQIFDHRPLHKRQLTSLIPEISTLDFNEPLEFYRIGDTLNDELNITRIEARKQYISIHRVCTKPEFEILIIINENKYDDYLKRTHEVSPKEYIKQYLEISDIKGYIDSHNLTNAIKEYKRLKKHDKCEMYLADILKE
ncbi:MAG: hypothetical protein MJ214_04140 [Bacilli bacterium]|nr:hypothetical protein [Bacilli bacterium]